MGNIVSQLTNRFFAIMSVLVISLVVMSGAARADHQRLNLVSFATPGAAVTVKRVELSSHTRLQAQVRMALQLDMQAIKVALPQQKPVQISQIRLHADKLELVGHRLHSVVTRQSTRPVKVWFEEVTLTIPRQYLSSSWDVLSLQKELERLGIKIKPKPSAPKPTTQLSG